MMFLQPHGHMRIDYEQRKKKNEKGKSQRKKSKRKVETAKRADVT